MQQEVVTVGLDLAKNVFQVHAIGTDGVVLVRRKLRRGEVIGFFSKLPQRWDRSIRIVASLGGRADRAWSRGAPYAAGVCEALCAAG